MLNWLNAVVIILTAIFGSDSDAANLERNDVPNTSLYPRTLGQPAYNDSATARDQQLYHRDGREPQVAPRNYIDSRVLLRDSGEARRHERALEGERRNTYRHN